MSKFRTVYDRIECFSNPGNPIQPEYDVAKDEDGQNILKVVGEYSLYDKIQSYKDSCDLQLILEKFKLTGDPSVINQKQTFYADVTEYPQNYAEMLNLSKKAEEFFYNLPSDDRDKFNNDPDVFFSSIGTDKFNEIFNSSADVVDDVISESEVVANE